MEHRGTGDLTGQMNLLLEKFTQSSFDKYSVTAMRTDLSSEQLQAICLTDGSNHFYGDGGENAARKTEMAVPDTNACFQGRKCGIRKAFYDQAMQETGDNGTPSPDTVVAPLEKKTDIEQLVTGFTLSDHVLICEPQK